MNLCVIAATLAIALAPCLVRTDVSHLPLNNQYLPPPAPVQTMTPPAIVAQVDAQTTASIHREASKDIVPTSSNSGLVQHQLPQSIQQQFQPQFHQQFQQLPVQQRYHSYAQAPTASIESIKASVPVASFSIQTESQQSYEAPLATAQLRPSAITAYSYTPPAPAPVPAPAPDPALAPAPATVSASAPEPAITMPAPALVPQNYIAPAPAPAPIAISVPAPSSPAVNNAYLPPRTSTQHQFQQTYNPHVPVNFPYPHVQHQDTHSPSAAPLPSVQQTHSAQAPVPASIPVPDQTYSAPATIVQQTTLSAPVQAPALGSVGHQIYSAPAPIVQQSQTHSASAPAPASVYETAQPAAKPVQQQLGSGASYSTHTQQQQYSGYNYPGGAPAITLQSTSNRPSGQQHGYSTQHTHTGLNSASGPPQQQFYTVPVPAPAQASIAQQAAHSQGAEQTYQAPVSGVQQSYAAPAQTIPSTYAASTAALTLPPVSALEHSYSVPASAPAAIRQQTFSSVGQHSSAYNYQPITASLVQRNIQNVPAPQPSTYSPPAPPAQSINHMQSAPVQLALPKSESVSFTAPLPLAPAPAPAANAFNTEYAPNGGYVYLKH